MRSRLYTTSVRAWHAMLAAIHRARTSIYLEMYIFEDNTPGFDFVSELETKALEGVRVVLVLDVFGSSQCSKEGIARLRSAGAEVRFFSYWFHRTHRKLLIVDEKIAFLGGVNIAQRFAHFDDLLVRLTGQVVRPIVHSFARIYRISGGGDPHLLERAPRGGVLRRARLWFVEHGLHGSRHALRAQYEAHINTAQRSIVLITPYLVPRRWLVESLHRALLRGVRVTILLPLVPDVRQAARVNVHFAALFERLGATCLFMPEHNHAKAMLVDEQVGTIGSQNLDPLSFDMNVESGVFFEQPDLVRQLARAIAQWKHAALPLKTISLPFRWFDHVISALLRLVTVV